MPENRSSSKAWISAETQTNHGDGGSTICSAITSSASLDEPKTRSGGVDRQLEQSSAFGRLLRMRTVQVFLLAGVVAVVAVGAAGAAETCTEHFRTCHATCVMKESDASGESCRHQCHRALRRCLSTGCAHGACGYTRT